MARESNKGAQSSDALQKYFLVMEDNDYHAELITEVLDTYFPPAVIHTVDNIKDGLSFLDQFEYNLILTDGVISGEPIFTHLFDLILLAKDTPVIVITGRGNEALAAKLSRAGVAEYLVKTKETLDKLPEILGKHIRRKK